MYIDWGQNNLEQNIGVTTTLILQNINLKLQIDFPVSKQGTTLVNQFEWECKSIKQRDCEATVIRFYVIL